MSPSDFIFSVSELFPSFHRFLHASKYPLLHFYLPLPCDFAIPDPLSFLLIKLTAPHTEIAIPHMFLDYWSVMLSLLWDHFFERAEYLLQSECPHKAIPVTLKFCLFLRLKCECSEGGFEQVVSGMSKELKLHGFFQIGILQSCPLGFKP